MTDPIVQWLVAQFDEDEQAVRRVLGEGALTAMEHGKPAPRWVPSPKGETGVWDTDGLPRVKHAWPRERDHIIRHDPARVLLEINSKRQLLREIFEYEARIDSEWGCSHSDPDDIAAGLCPSAPLVHITALRLLAAPYENRPGYPEAWQS